MCTMCIVRMVLTVCMRAKVHICVCVSSGAPGNSRFQKASRKIATQYPPHHDIVGYTTGKYPKLDVIGHAAINRLLSVPMEQTR